MFAIKCLLACFHFCPYINLTKSLTRNYLDGFLVEWGSWKDWDCNETKTKQRNLVCQPESFGTLYVPTQQAHESMSCDMSKDCPGRKPLQ